MDAAVRAEKMVFTSQFTPRDFVPDGNLQKPVWQSANKVEFDQDPFLGTHHPGLETIVASLWTPDYLYLAFWAKYRTVNTFTGEDPNIERWELWDRDVVEAFINPQPERELHYYEFEVAPNNQWVDLELDLTGTPVHNAQWNSGFQHVAVIDEKQHVWTVEIRIPVRPMGVQKIDPHTEWRINFYRMEDVGQDHARQPLGWSPLGAANKSFHQPAHFGVLKFAAPNE